jgi:hypothetical protein
MFKPIFAFLLILLASPLYAHEWGEHIGEIEELERNIMKLQQEMEVLVEKKKNTREQARIEQTLQRIVEIHAELISLRGNMDHMRLHVESEHPDKIHVLDNHDSRMMAYKNKKGRLSNSPLSHKLDDLLLKVQMKYSTFIRTDDKTDEMIAVEKVVKDKRKRKKEREADVYLRKRAKIKLVK